MLLILACVSLPRQVKPIYWHLVVVKENVVFTAKQGVQVASTSEVWIPQKLSGKGF